MIGNTGLENELEVLLVQDADTDKASAAMDVNVGNFSDPKDMPGLAHCVEHIVSICLFCCLWEPKGYEIYNNNVLKSAANSR